MMRAAVIGAGGGPGSAPTTAALSAACSQMQQLLGSALEFQRCSMSAAAGGQAEAAPAAQQQPGGVGADLRLLAREFACPARDAVCVQDLQ